MRKIAWIILLSVFIFQLGRAVINYWPRYTQNLGGPYWKTRYLESQWVVPDSKNSIGDDGLYAYHGYELVMGGDPTLINPEVPPLGKYLIGLCVLFLHNNNIFGLFTGIYCLTMFYLLNRVLFKDRLLAFIPLVLFVCEPLFVTQLQASYLDTLLLGTLFLSFFLFLKKWYIPAMMSVGCLAAIKFSYLSVFVVAAMGAYFLLRNNSQDRWKFIVPMVFVPGILLLSYLNYFLLGHTIIDFLKVQKYIINFYAIGAKAPIPVMVIPMLFLDKWYTWWNGVMKIDEWTILWPLATLGGLLSIFYLKQAGKFLLLMLWVAAYFVFLLLTPVWPRYLLLFLPFLYNLSIWALSQNTKLRSFFQ
ncbi:MAG TPA: hypothetical protein VG935_04950 [Patescibacteria group bacterium]|nr:hypothetical protein [Patescibacteria group bacterium]